MSGSRYGVDLGLAVETLASFGPLNSSNDRFDLIGQYRNAVVIKHVQELGRQYYQVSRPC